MNNDHNSKTHLGDGANGGGYGESGSSIIVSGEVLVEGGTPGYAIRIEDSFLDIEYFLYSPESHSSAQINISTDPQGKDTLDQDFFSGEIVDV